MSIKVRIVKKGTKKAGGAKEKLAAVSHFYGHAQSRMASKYLKRKK